MCHRSLAVSGPEHAVGSTRSLRQLLTLIAPERNTKSMDRDSKRAGEDEIMKERKRRKQILSGIGKRTGSRQGFATLNSSIDHEN